MSEANKEAPVIQQNREMQAPLTVLNQYIKDFSFEVPDAPRIYAELKAMPQGQMNFDVNVRKLAQENTFEVACSVKIEAKAVDPAKPQDDDKAKTAFIIEIVYAGVFALNNVPQEHVDPILMIECPRLLFPYLRHIVAATTRDGGFPPVVLSPIDFVALFQARQAYIQQQAVQSQEGEKNSGEKAEAAPAKAKSSKNNK